MIKKAILSVPIFFNFLYFFLRSSKYYRFRLPLSNGQAGIATILANGPSLKSDLPSIVENRKPDSDVFFVLNFFAFDNAFWTLKPVHYCFADPMFFQENHRKEDVRRLFDLLNDRVNWKLNIHIPAHELDKFLKYSKITNTHITIKPINATPYMGPQKFRNFFFKNGWGTPVISTVAVLAIFVAINHGFKQINLFGVDHSFFDSICINEDNELCNKESHFYNNSPVLSPIVRNDNNEIWKISDYVFSIGEMFRSHDLLQGYAQLLNVKIINHTKGSLIDSYSRSK